jgi:chlorobactene lauroyltransferase
VTLPYPPPPRATAAWLFDRYIRGQLRRHFAAVHWTARGRPERWNRGLPTLFVANHTSWWDGFVACLVTRRLGLRFQVLMEAEHLARYKVFLRVGALPLRRSHPRQAYADLSAASGYLQPQAGLWIFPQGARRPPRDPIGRCERGAAQLALRAGREIRICPVAFRYAFVGEQLPEAFVFVGEEWRLQPGTFSARAPLMTAIEDRLAATLSEADALIDRERLDGFQSLAEGRLSVNKRLDRFRHAVGLLRGPFEARNG